MNSIFLLFLLTITIATTVRVLSFSSSSITKPIQYQSCRENNPRQIHEHYNNQHQHQHQHKRFINNQVVKVFLLSSSSSSSLSSCSSNNSRQQIHYQNLFHHQMTTCKHNARRRSFQRFNIVSKIFPVSNRIELSKLYNYISDDDDDDDVNDDEDTYIRPMKLGNRYNIAATTSVMVGAILSIVLLLLYRKSRIKIVDIDITLTVIRSVVKWNDIILFCRAGISIFGSVGIGLYIDYLLLNRNRKKNNNQSKNDTNTATKTTTKVSTIPLSVLPPWLVSTSKSASSWTILTTLCVSAIISTIGIAPKPPHILYDACWTYFLPLSFLLLSLKSTTGSNEQQRTITIPETTTTSSGGAGRSTSTMFAPAKQRSTTGSANTTTRTAIIRLAIPFVLACIGSYVGCYISFLCFRHVLFSSSISTVTLSSTSIAAIASSCLLSSFIGGSINFMATASTIVASLSLPSTATSLSTTKTFSNLLSAMSTADIIVMAIYFFMLSSMLEIKQLQCLFSSSIPLQQQQEEKSSLCGSDKAVLHPSERIIDRTTLNEECLNTSSTNVSTTPASLTNNEALNKIDPMITMTNTSKSCLTEEPIPIAAAQRLNHTIVPMLISCLISLSIVWSSRQMERFVVQSVIAIPGTACAFIALLTPIVANIVTKYVSFIQKRWYTIQTISQILSNVSFLLLFACLGVTADMYNTFVGNGLSCFIFSLVALVLHVSFVLLSSLIYYTIMKCIFIPKSGPRVSASSLVGIQSNQTAINNYNYCTKWWSTSLIDILVASNAAIGGPATAAAFCGTIKQSSTMMDDTENDYNNNNTSFLQWQKGLTIAATFWGVVGYAIGTTVGLSYYRFLQTKYFLM